MEFCEKCGGLMLPRAQAETALLVCRVCGNSKATVGNPTQSYQVTRRMEKTPHDETVIIDDESVEKPRTMPVTTADCTKCGNRQAYWWMMQTRRADEASTRFFKCTRCGYTWREYD